MRRLAFFLQIFCLILFLPAAYAGDPPPAGAGAGTTSAEKKKTSAPKKQKGQKQNDKPAPATAPEAAKETSGNGPVGEFQQRTEQPPAPASAMPGQAAPTVEPGQAYIEFRYNVDNTDIQGNRDRSFLNPGVNHTSEVSAFTNNPIWSIRRFESLIVHRYTDNPRVDPERNSLQRFYFRLTGPSFETNVGDSLVNYSRFTFNQNIKGLNTWKNWTPDLRWTGTFGLFADRWGSIYRNFQTYRNIQLDCQGESLPGAPASGCVESPPGSGAFVLSPANPTKPYTRLVGGTRLEQKTGRNSFVAFNLSHGTDQLQSLPDAFVTCLDPATDTRTVRQLSPGCQAGEQEVNGTRRPASEAFSNDVVSFDSSIDWQAARLRANGEFAYSWTTGGTPRGATAANFLCASNPPVVGGAVLDSRCFTGRVGDMASRFDVTQRIKRLNWRADYSRFETNFFSANARQIRDLQDFNIRGELELARQATVIGSWRRSNDNLNQARNFTSIVRAPEVRLVLRQLPFYRKLSIEGGYRERNLDTSLQNPTGTTCQDNEFKHPTIRPAGSCLTTETEIPNLVRIRSTQIPFLSVSIPITGLGGDTILGFDYEHRGDRDTVTPALSADTDRFAFSYRGNYNWNGWDVIPSFRMEVERLDKNLTDDPALSPTNTALSFPADFFTAFDSNRSFQAGLMIEPPRYFRIEANYREFNSLTLSALRASTQLDPAGNFFYFNQGFKRPNWRASVTYKIANDEGKTVTAFYERSNNFFDPGDPFVRDVKSFRETVIGGTIVIRFRQ